VCPQKVHLIDEQHPAAVDHGWAQIADMLWLERQ
jgi:hypothetical protein